MESKNVVDSGFYCRTAGFRIPQTIFLEDSGIRAQGYLIWDNKYLLLMAPHVKKSFACGIGNPGLWDPAYSSRNPANVWNPESKFHLQGIWNPVPGIRNPWRGIQNPRLSWIPAEANIDSNL